MRLSIEPGAVIAGLRVERPLGEGATGALALTRRAVPQGDLTPDGELTAHKVSGQFNVGTAPAQGIVIHDAGMLRIDEDGLVTILHGIHDVFDNGEDAFCEALAP